MNRQKSVKYSVLKYIKSMDPRIAPWMKGKFVAKILNYSFSKNPILYKVEDDSGHSESASSDNIYQKWAEMFDFGLWQAGHL